MPSYLDTSTFYARTGLTSTTVAAEQVGPMLDAIEYLIRLHIGYEPLSASRTEYYSTDGSDRVALWPRPVTAITSVHLNPQGYYQDANFTADELLTEGEDYVLEVDGSGRPGILRRIHYRWPIFRARYYDRLASHRSTAYGCLKVVFTAGLAPPQMALLKEVGYQAAAAMYQLWRNGIGPKSSEGLDGYSYSLLNMAQGQQGLSPFVSPFAVAMLKPICRIPVA